MKRFTAALVILVMFTSWLPAPAGNLAETSNPSQVRIKSVAAGTQHTIGLRMDGTLLSAGDNSFGQCNVSAWTDIMAVAAGECHTVGLTKSGKVLAAGINEFGQCDVGGWSNIIAVSASDRTTLGLRKDGTVSAAGDNSLGQCDVGGWTGIVAVSAGPRHSVGLKSDGTVVAAGDNQYRQCNTSRWSGIRDISAGDSHTVALKKDGTAVALGYNADGRCDVGLWTDIVDIAAGGEHTVGIRRDGSAIATGADPDGRCDVGGWTGIAEIATGKWHTVGVKKNGAAVAVGRNDDGQCDVYKWAEPGLSVTSTIAPVRESTPEPTAAVTAVATVAVTAVPQETTGTEISTRSDIVAVAAGRLHSVGLKKDGTVLAVGDNRNGACDVGAWRDIVEVAGGDSFTVGLRKDGAVVATGYNEFGQCDVGSWTDITAIAAGRYHTIGLKRDGTVVVAGKEGLLGEVGAWTDIVGITSSTDISAAGLKRDGTVVGTKGSTRIDFDKTVWRDLIAISAGTWNIVGLKGNGTVVALGYNGDRQGNVEDWSDIIDISAGERHTLGLKRDGTVVATGYTADGRCDVGGLTDIIDISAGLWHTVTLKRDGTVAATGTNDFGQCDVGAWMQAPLPPADEKTLTPGPSSTPVATAAVTPVPTAAATPAPRMTPATEGPAFDSPLNGLYANTFEVLLATVDGSTPVEYARMLGNKSTMDSTIAMTGETAGVMVFSGSYGGSGSMPLTFTDGEVRAGYRDETSGADVSYVGTLSRQDGRIRINGEYRTSYRDAASGSVTEISGTWTAVSTRGVVSDSLDTSKAKADVSFDDLQGKWTGACLIARFENMDKIPDMSQAEKDQMQSMIGAEFPMHATFEEDALTLVMMQGEQEADIADRVAFSLERGVFTATEVQSEGIINISGVIFLEGARLALTGVIETQMSPPGEEAVTVTLVMDFNLIKESGGDQGNAAPQATAAVTGLGTRSDIVAVAAGRLHSVGLKKDGTVLAVGDNRNGACDVGAWRDIVRIAAGNSFTVGLRKDGAVVAVGYNEFGQCDVGSWTDIMAIAAGMYYTIGLKRDGTVVAASNKELWLADVGAWTDIVEISAGDAHAVGLKRDGTVVGAGWSARIDFDETVWRDLVAVSAGNWNTVGLKGNGTVVALGYNGDSQGNVEGWSDIIDISAGERHTLGLKRDGTVVAAGANVDGRSDVGGLTDIVGIAAGLLHTVTLKRDGTVAATGTNDFGQCDVEAWMQAPLPSADEKTLTPNPTSAPVATAAVTPAPTPTMTPVPTAAVTPALTAAVTPVPTAAATPAPQMTPAAEGPAFDSPLNGPYANTFEVLRATVDGSTPVEYAMMLGKKSTTDSTIAMTGETAGVMVFSGSYGGSGSIPLTFTDGEVRAGYRDEASGTDVSYVGTLSRQDGRIRISGEYRTTFQDTASGSVTEISGLWTAASTRGVVSDSLDISKAKTDVSFDEIKGEWTGVCLYARFENMDKIPDMSQAQKDQMQSVIGVEFPMKATFEEDTLTLVGMQGGQEGDIADRVAVSLEKGVFTATEFLSDGLVNISGVIFLEGPRLALTGVIEAQMSPSEEEDVTVTVVMDFNLTKERGGDQGSAAPQATAEAVATATPQAPTAEPDSTATPGPQGDEPGDEWVFGGDRDPALVNVLPGPPVSGTGAQTVAAGEALTVSIAKNGLDKDRTLALAALGEEGVERLSQNPGLADQLVFDAYEFDAGLTRDDLIPGAFELRYDLSKSEIPPALYDSVRVFRLDEEGESPQMLACRLEGSVLVAESSQNSILGWSVALGLVYLSAYPIQSQRQFTEYFDDEPVLFHQEKDLSRYGFYWPWSLGFGDPAALRQMLEDEFSVYKMYNALPPQYDPGPDIDAALKANDLYNPNKALREYWLSGIGSLSGKIKAVVNVLLSPEWEALKHQYTDKWMQEKILPRQVSYTIQCARIADTYLHTVRKFDPPSCVKVFISKKIQNAGESINPAFHDPYLVMPVDPKFENPAGGGYKPLLDEYLSDFTHELFHVTQAARYVYTYEFAAYTWFWEATAVMLQDEADAYYKTCPSSLIDLSFYPKASANLMDPGFKAERFNFDHAYAKALGLYKYWGEVKDYYQSLRRQGYMTGYLLSWLRDKHVAPGGVKADDYLKKLMEAFRGSKQKPIYILIEQTSNSFDQFKLLAGQYLRDRAPLIAAGYDLYRNNPNDSFYPSVKEDSFFLTAGQPVAKILPGYSPLASPMRPLELYFDKQKYSKPEDISLVIRRGAEAYQSDQYLPLQLGRQIKQGNAISYDFKEFAPVEGIQAFPGFGQTDFAYVQEIHLYPASWVTDYFDEPYLVFAMLKPDGPKVTYDAVDSRLTVELPPRSPLWGAALVDQYFVTFVDPKGNSYPIVTDKESFTIDLDSTGAIKYDDETLRKALQAGLRIQLEQHPEYRAELEAKHGKDAVKRMLESSYLADLDIGAMLRSSNVLNTIVSGQGSAASGKNEYSFKVREITQGKQGVFGPESDEVKVDVPIRNTGDIDIRGVWKAKDMFSQFEGTVVISAGNFGYDYKIDTWESYPASGESQTTEYGRNKHNGVIELVLYLKEYGMPLTGNEALWSTMIINSENEIYRVAPAMVLHRVK